MEYTVLDIETTGLSKHRHRITEIAAVKFKDGKKMDEFHSLVNPECHIPSFITKLTGIDDDMVKDAPKINDIMEQFNSFLGDSIIVAHNATFDYGFLSHNSEIITNKPLCNDRLCTRRLASRLLPDIGSKKLSSVCEYFDVINETAHRAMSDTLATVDIFHNFLDIMKEIGIEEERDMIKFQTLPVYKCHRLLSDN